MQSNTNNMSKKIIFIPRCIFLAGYSEGDYVTLITQKKIEFSGSKIFKA